MPEMPEVENMALGLREIVVGKCIEDVYVETPAMIRGPHPRRWRRFLGDLTGRRIECVARRAKRLILAAEGDFALVFQLGMTGKFLLPPRCGACATWTRTTPIRPWRPWV